MNNKSFTLVELLIIVALISLLATIIFVTLGGTQVNTRDAKRLSDLNQLRKTLDIYFDKYDQYPSDGKDACDSGNYIAVNGVNDPLTLALKSSGVLAQGMTDPEINSGCAYFYGRPGWWDCAKSYQIEMRFETRDGAAQASRAGADCWDYSGDFNWGSGVCAGYNCALLPQ